MHLNQEALFFLQAIILIGAPYALWYFKIVRKIFPVVVLQVLVGILFGPSILGHLNPTLFESLFPATSLAFINGISWIAVTFFGFLTGLHFDISEVRKKGTGFMITSVSSLVVPFLFAIGLLFFFPQLYTLLAGPSATPLTLFISLGIIMSVTALPVLAGILIEMNLLKEPLGRTVLSYATVNDGFLWILVSVLFILISGGSIGNFSFVLKLLYIFLYLFVMVSLVRPFLVKLVSWNKWTKEARNIELVSIAVLTFFSAFIGELVGIHYFLGAFLLGAIVPKELSNILYDKLKPLVFAVLLPFFFMSIGLKTQFDFASSQIWIIFGVVTLFAIVGKFIGVVVPATLVNKMSFVNASILGVFMQCKGLMEIVVLTMVFNAGIINPVAFSGLIFMTLLTTSATKPVVRLIQKIKPH